mmetsp:Transcript_32639/g.80800  ORF Transcript_32639/g.80800 Transcript_32639/m.80800 type:complete len:794 (+) Transcript_32639:153-2534(+)
MARAAALAEERQRQAEAHMQIRRHDRESAAARRMRLIEEHRRRMRELGDNAEGLRRARELEEERLRQLMAHLEDKHGAETVDEGGYPVSPQAAAKARAALVRETQARVNNLYLQEQNVRRATVFLEIEGRQLMERLAHEEMIEKRASSMMMISEEGEEGIDPFKEGAPPIEPPPLHPSLQAGILHEQARQTMLEEQRRQSMMMMPPPDPMMLMQQQPARASIMVPPPPPPQSMQLSPEETARQQAFRHSVHPLAMAARPGGPLLSSDERSLAQMRSSSQSLELSSEKAFQQQLLGVPPGGLQAVPSALHAMPSGTSIGQGTVLTATSGGSDQMAAGGVSRSVPPFPVAPPTVTGPDGIAVVPPPPAPLQGQPPLPPGVSPAAMAAGLVPPPHDLAAARHGSQAIPGLGGVPLLSPEERGLAHARSASHMIELAPYGRTYQSRFEIQSGQAGQAGPPAAGGLTPLAPGAAGQQMIFPPAAGVLGVPGVIPGGVGEVVPSGPELSFPSPTGPAGAVSQQIILPGISPVVQGAAAVEPEQPGVAALAGAAAGPGQVTQQVPVAGVPPGVSKSVPPATQQEPSLSSPPGGITAAGPVPGVGAPGNLPPALQATTQIPLPTATAIGPFPPGQPAALPLSGRPGAVVGKYRAASPFPAATGLTYEQWVKQLAGRYPVYEFRSATPGPQMMRSSRPTASMSFDHLPGVRAVSARPMRRRGSSSCLVKNSPCSCKSKVAKGSREATRAAIPQQIAMAARKDLTDSAVSEWMSDNGMTGPVPREALGKGLVVNRKSCCRQKK